MHSVTLEAIPYAMFTLEGEPCHRDSSGEKWIDVVLEGIIDCAKTCIENNIPVGLGSDVSCPFVVHYNFWRELYYFNKYIGRSAQEAIHRATLGNAAIAGIDKETGSIEAGKSADMIAVKGNPLDDLTAPEKCLHGYGKRQSDPQATPQKNERNRRCSGQIYVAK